VEPRRPDPSARRAVSALPASVRHPRGRLLKFAPRQRPVLIMRRSSGHLCCPDSEKPDSAYGIPDAILRQIGRDNRPRRAAATSSGPRADHRPAMTRRLNRQFFKSLNPPRPAVAPPHLPACSGAPASRNARLNIGMILAMKPCVTGTLSVSEFMVSQQISTSGGVPGERCAHAEEGRCVRGPARRTVLAQRPARVAEERESGPIRE